MCQTLKLMFLYPGRLQSNPVWGVVDGRNYFSLNICIFNGENLVTLFQSWDGFLKSESPLAISTLKVFASYNRLALA